MNEAPDYIKAAVDIYFTGGAVSCALCPFSETYARARILVPAAD